jgi:RNA polymerase sigma-70 factor (ECF subfamily)
MNGDFADFYRQHFGELAGYGWSLTRDPHVGDDLAQEAMTRVYARWPVLQEPRPYAYRIVTNLVRDRWRAEVRAAATGDPRAGAQTTPGPDSGTFDAVRRLPPDLRDVVALHYYADMPVAEIAKVLRRPLGTVKRRLHDARAALAAALTEELR